MLSFKNKSLALIATGNLAGMNLYEKKNKIYQGEDYFIKKITGIF